MRGRRQAQGNFVSLINVEELIAADHPIRRIKAMCDEVLGRMGEHFEEIYAAEGRPSIPPETLLKGEVLQGQAQTVAALVLLEARPIAWCPRARAFQW